MYDYFQRLSKAYPKIVAFKRGDVNGDRIQDNVFLTGVKNEDSPFIQKLTLVIADGRTGQYASIPLMENAGYDPTLFLGDFNGDGVEDILVSINSGGSGAFMYHYIYSFVNNKPKLMFDFNVYNEKYKYYVNYLDNYKVEVLSRENNERYILDIAYKGIEYLNEIYDKNGKLKKAVEGFVNPLSGLYPVDFNSDKIYQLLAFQKIAGRYNADALGYVQNILSWKDEAFVLQSQYVAILGTEAQLQ